MKLASKVVTIAKLPLIVAVGFCGAVILNVFSRHVALELARRNES